MPEQSGEACNRKTFIGKSKLIAKKSAAYELIKLDFHLLQKGDS
jgi:hypothetical protein